MDKKPFFYEDITPDEFEAFVEECLKIEGAKFENFSTSKKEIIGGSDGSYEIDVVIRFTALKVDFLVLVECKKHKNSIKREDVQVLHSRMLELGAQKGILYSTAPFQSGALDFAAKHKIALVEVVDGRATYFRRSFGLENIPYPSFVPKVAGCRVHVEEGREHRTLVGMQNPEGLGIFLKNI